MTEAAAGPEGSHEAEPSPGTPSARVKGPVSWGILTLSVLAVTYTLYFAKDIILPIVVALILALVLAPAMRFLSHRLRLPRALAAVVVIAAVFGAVAAVGFTVSRPAIGWIRKVPESLPVLKEKLAAVRAPIDFLENGLRELQAATAEASAAADEEAPRKDAAGGANHGQVTLGSLTGLAGSLASGTAGIASKFLETMIVLFFLLVSGDRLLRGFIDALPGAKDKRNMVRIARKIEANVAGYLGIITLMNAGVGIATGLAM